MEPRKVRELPLTERPLHRASYSTRGCSMVELLAVLIGGDDQLQTATDVMAMFGETLGTVTVNELTVVPGIGPVLAARLVAAIELGRRSMVPPNGSRMVVNSPEDAAALLLSLAAGREQELLWVLALDTRNKVIGAPIEVYHGSLNMSLIRVGEVLRPAILRSAASVIVAHNHPSGDPTPSPEDVAVTRALVEAGRLLDVEVLDHVVLGAGQWVSLKAKGLGFG